MCKPVMDGDENKLMVCQEGGCYLISPTTCLKGLNQSFCFDSRCAFPCDEEVPCLLTVCFITCVHNYKVHFGFFETMSQIDPSLVAVAAPPLPNIEVHNVYLHSEPQPATHAVPVTSAIPVVNATSPPPPAPPSVTPPPPTPAVPAPPAPESSAPPPPPSSPPAVPVPGEKE